MAATVPALAFEITDGFDPGRTFIQRVPSMVDQARDAAENDAYSYRGFKVGAAVLAYNPHTRETGVLAAGNLKIRPDKAKFCAEYRSLQIAKRSGLTVVGGIVVAATTDKHQIGEVTDVETRTLHPCSECRQLFCDHPLMRDDTLILTTGIDSDVYQVHTNDELQKLYADHYPDALEGRPTQFGFEHWDQHLETYDRLRAAEATLSEDRQRGIAQLAQMALLTAPQ